jgi:hypothetical protein
MAISRFAFKAGEDQLSVNWWDQENHESTIVATSTKMFVKWWDNVMGEYQESECSFGHESAAEVLPQLFRKSAEIFQQMGDEAQAQCKKDGIKDAKIQARPSKSSTQVQVIKRPATHRNVSKPLKAKAVAKPKTANKAMRTNH